MDERCAKAAYLRLGKYLDTADDEEILRDVMDRIAAADIWILFGERKALSEHLRKSQKAPWQGDPS